MEADRQGRPSLARLYRDFSARWEIEAVPPGTKWIAVLRESDGDNITFVVANEVSTLRFRMGEIEHGEPAGPA